MEAGAAHVDHTFVPGPGPDVVRQLLTEGRPIAVVFHDWIRAEPEAEGGVWSAY